MNFYFLKNVTVLLPRIMSGSILPLQGMCLACVTSKGHAEHHGSLCCHLWPCGCLWGRVPLDTILIALAHVPWEAMLMSLAYAAMESYDGFHGLSWSRRLCWCLWSVLTLDTMPRSLAHADARDHVDVSGLCCLQKPRGSSWSRLQLTVKDKKATMEWYRWLHTHSSKIGT